MNTITTSHQTIFKPILILSILLIFAIPSYSQQNSKSIEILSKTLREPHLFQESLDTIAKKFQANITSHSKYKNQKQYEGNGLTAIKLQIGSVNDIVKIKPIGVRLFDNFKPDSILLYFNSGSLYKCVLHFMLTTEKVQNMYNTIAYDFGVPSKTSDGNWSGPLWMEGSGDLTMFYNEKNPGEIRLEFETPTNEQIFQSAANNDHDKIEGQIKTDRQGKGRSIFSRSLPMLESTIKSHITKTQLEQRLSNWTSYGADNDLGYEYDEVTKSMSIPLFQLHYETTIKFKPCVIKVEILKDLKNPISYLEITTSLNGYELALFKQSLLTGGYFLNENLTKIFRKATFQNRAKNLMVTISENNNGDYVIGIR